MRILVSFNGDYDDDDGPPHWRRDGAFASHAEDRVSIPGRDRHKS